MAARRKAQERVQNYPSLFPELEGEAYGGSLNPTKKPRRGLKSSQGYNYKGKEPTSREKRNTRLWASLYPTPTKGREKELIEI